MDKGTEKTAFQLIAECIRAGEMMGTDWNELWMCAVPSSILFVSDPNELLLPEYRSDKKKTTEIAPGVSGYHVHIFGFGYLALHGYIFAAGHD